MKYVIAIQSMQHIGRTLGDRESSSDRWTEHLRAAGYEVRNVDVCRPDIIEQVRGCDGFMWRHEHTPHDRAIARRLLPTLEYQMGLLVYPDQSSCWHFDDKISQQYLFRAAAIPQPLTWVFWREQDAIDFANSAKYPLVLKLWSGAQSDNVRLVRNAQAATDHVQRLFRHGVFGLSDDYSRSTRSIRRRVRRGFRYLSTGLAPIPTNWEVHRGYVLFQEFLPGNDHDTRITVVGRRAFGFRRLNRDDDFRASGSGRISWEPQAIDWRFVRLAYLTAERLRLSSCAIDGLWSNGKPVVSEISYTYASWAIDECPGHWELLGNAETGRLEWREGRMTPEQAQVEDFVEKLRHRTGVATT